MWKKNPGNTIGNEGCMLTSLAMVLHLLDDRPIHPAWTPTLLNEEAHARHFYTLAGISMVPLYADLVSEVTQGEVQLCAKEDYFPGEPKWPRNYASTSLLVRAYRQLSQEDRKHYAVMLKTGTYDDTFASHYVLLDPNDPGDPDDKNPVILDPIMPKNANSPWRLSNSADFLRSDKKVKKAWDDRKIKRRQIGGVWLFARWQGRHAPLLMGSLAEALASEMKSNQVAKEALIYSLQTGTTVGLECLMM